MKRHYALTCALLALPLAYNNPALVIGDDGGYFNMGLGRHG